MRRRPDPVILWLFACCGMIFIMALLGAVTRLTESGLSITEWKPIAGILPPLNEAAWNRAFADYQAIPQYQLFNRGMSLEAFKGIYFWEWFHRLWGRLIGVVFALPLLWFFAAGKISRGFFLKLCGILALGGLQGFIGWFMVQSGLEVRTTVSPYRLALHLGFALLLYSLLLWTALRTQGRETPPAAPAPPLRHGWIALGFLATTIVWGAFVAGLRAGEVYNTWPLMDGSLLPGGVWSLQPAWQNIFANTALVQFAHRWLGPTTFFVILGWVARCWPSATPRQKPWLLALDAMAVTQVVLGIGTLLSHVWIVVAVAHQAGAITLLTLLLINLSSFYGTPLADQELAEACPRECGNAPKRP
jgi:cytochrome c oxidase assembly protein subunit 15